MAHALHAVALAALLVLAGCTGSPPATSTTETSTQPQTTTTTTVADTTTSTQVQTHTTSDGHYRAYKVRAEETTIDAVAAELAQSPEDLARWDDTQAALVRSAAATGNASRVKLDPRVSLGLDGELVVVNGTYYRVNATIDWREHVTAHNIEADGPLGNRYAGDELDTYRDRAINYSALPLADRRAVTDTIHVADDPFQNYHGIGNWYYFENGTVPKNSTLADGQTQIIRYNDTLWKIQLNPSQTSEQVRYRVTYTLDTVAENKPTWNDYVRQNNITTLENVSVPSDSRDILRNAIGNGSVEWEGTTEDTPQRFKALHQHSRLYYVTQNGTLYRITVQVIVE